MNYLGIDIGTTNIKIVQADKTLKILNSLILDMQDPKIALQTFIEKYNINISNIQKIISTGIGANKLKNDFMGIKEVISVPEFTAISNAGRFVIESENFVVASIGTGTAFVKNVNNEAKHAGGTGIGGATLINLCQKIIPEITFDKIDKITKNEDRLNNVDLWIKDITDEEIKTLPKNITSANFGKLDRYTPNEDVVLGISNMVFETIGVMASFVAKEDKIKNIIAIGQLVKMPFAKVVFDKIGKLHNVKFIIPQNPEYMVAIGAIKELI